MTHKTWHTPITAVLLSLVLSACATTPSRTQQNREVLQVSAMVAGELQGVRQELAALRQDIQGLRARLDTMGAPQSQTPKDALAVGADAPDSTPSDNSGALGGPTLPVPYRILKEWGRTPEIAAQNNAASLKGMVCVVPPSVPPQALERLGRDLRTQYDNYDNITIDIFDQDEAAKQFIERPVRNPAHRVLHVSRFRKDNQDMVVVFRDGQARSVGF